MQRRDALRSISGAGLAVATWRVLAQGSANPIKVVVPYAAGGQTDIIVHGARVTGARVKEPGSGLAMQNMTLRALHCKT